MPEETTNEVRQVMNLPPETKETGTEAERQVPYDRFKKVNDSKKEIERQLSEAKAALEERETQDMGEVDKLRRAVEKAEQRAKDLEQKAAENEQRATNLERSGWVRSEATKLGFTDPEDAVAFVSLGDIEDQARASKAVADLAKRKAHLIAKKDDAGPGLSKILENGEATATDGAKTDTRLAEAQMISQELAKLVRN